MGKRKTMKPIKADKKEDRTFRGVIEKLGMICDVDHKTQTQFQFYCPFIHKKDFDSALSQFSKKVLAEKKGRKIYFGEDQSSDKVKGWNACCEHIAKLILRG